MRDSNISVILWFMKALDQPQLSPGNEEKSSKYLLYSERYEVIDREP